MRKICEKYLIGFVFSGLSLCPCLSMAQVATAPLSSDQRLVNPAAATSRIFQGYNFNARRELEKTAAPTRSDSSLNIETQVDSFNFNGGWRHENFCFEANLLPQVGKRVTNSTWSESGVGRSSEFARQLSLIPLQGVAAMQLGRLGSVGVKALYTHADVNAANKVGYTYDLDTETVDRTGSQSFGFLAVTAGFTAEVFSSGFFVAYSSEYLQEKSDENFSTTTSYFSTDANLASTVNTSGKKTTSLRKDILGIGYVHKMSGNEVVRTDLSYEKMPSRDLTIPDGQLVRLVTEATWSYFHAGAQLTSTSGYYIDPYNLIPYFFGTQDLTAQSTIEYGFFGGLKSSKGHGFGLSYSQSKEKKDERLSQNSSSTINVERQLTTFSLSYSYIF